MKPAQKPFVVVFILNYSDRTKEGVTFLTSLAPTEKCRIRTVHKMICIAELNGYILCSFISLTENDVLKQLVAENDEGGIFPPLACVFRCFPAQPQGAQCYRYGQARGFRRTSETTLQLL